MDLLFFDFQNTIIIAIVLVGAMALISFALMKLLDGKFPKLKFMVFEGNNVKFLIQRLDGNKVVPDDLLGLIMHKNLLGEDIRRFKRSFFIGFSAEPIYLASLVNKILIPLEYKDHIKESEVKKLAGHPIILPEEITNGALLGQRYRELLKATEQVSKAQEPLILSIVSVLPIAIVIGIFLLGIWLSAGSITDMLTKSADHTSGLINAQQRLAETLMNMSK